MDSRNQFSWACWVEERQFTYVYGPQESVMRLKGLTQPQGTQATFIAKGGADTLDEAMDHAERATRELASVYENICLVTCVPVDHFVRALARIRPKGF